MRLCRVFRTRRYVEELRYCILLYPSTTIRVPRQIVIEGGGIQLAIEFNRTSAYPPLSLGEVMCFDVTCDVIAVCAWYCVYTYICIHIIRASKAHRPIGIWSGCMYANRQCGAVLCLPPSHKKGSAPAPGRRRKVLNKDEPKGKSGQQSKQWSLSFKFVVPPHHQAQSKYGTRGLDFTSPR